ncbi:MAG TPA: NAD-dependent epimerase/dehydratase family protein [Gallionellaceae bacterium]|nr:NAD-dependent epimerase/dehydratase family protein [Gallionellaceae bacterium]
MIVAITGGTGFIGRKLVERHLARGDAVRVLTRRPVHQGDLPAGVAAFVGDLAQYADLRAFVDQADVLYHCAGEIRDPARMAALHVEGTRRLISEAGHCIGRWVQLSSVGVYGQPRAGRITEASPLDPRGPYETTKRLSDDLVQRAGEAGAFEWSMLRPSIVFGEAMPNQSLFQLIRFIDRERFFFIGKPGASANYIPVDNVIDALLLCAQQPAAAGRTFNLSDYATLEDFVAIIAAVLGKDPPRRRLPEFPVRVLAEAGTALTRRFPLTPSRVDAMTTRVRYPTDAIENALGYTHRLTLQAAMQSLVNSWKERHHQVPAHS